MGEANALTTAPDIYELLNREDYDAGRVQAAGMFPQDDPGAARFRDDALAHFGLKEHPQAELIYVTSLDMTSGGYGVRDSGEGHNSFARALCDNLAEVAEKLRRGESLSGTLLTITMPDLSEIAPASTREYFTHEEAEAKIGKEVESLVKFSGVPKGTRGIVKRADPSGQEGYTVGIEWRLPHRGEQGVGGDESECLIFASEKPLVDWFCKSEYISYLRELEEGA